MTIPAELVVSSMEVKGSEDKTKIEFEKTLNKLLDKELLRKITPFNKQLGIIDRKPKTEESYSTKLLKNGQCLPENLESFKETSQQEIEWLKNNRKSNRNAKFDLAMCFLFGLTNFPEELNGQNKKKSQDKKSLELIYEDIREVATKGVFLGKYILAEMILHNVHFPEKDKNGHKHFNGKNIKKEKKRWAYEFYFSAACNGLAIAYTALGICLKDGIFVPDGIESNRLSYAKELLNRAVAKGDVIAKDALAKLEQGISGGKKLLTFEHPNYTLLKGAVFPKLKVEKMENMPVSSSALVSSNNAQTPAHSASPSTVVKSQSLVPELEVDAVDSADYYSFESTNSHNGSHNGNGNSSHNGNNANNGAHYDSDSLSAMMPIQTAPMQKDTERKEDSNLILAADPAMYSAFSSTTNSLQDDFFPQSLPADLELPLDPPFQPQQGSLPKSESSSPKMETKESCLQPLDGNRRASPTPMNSNSNSNSNSSSTLLRPHSNSNTPSSTNAEADDLASDPSLVSLVEFFVNGLSNSGKADIDASFPKPVLNLNSNSNSPATVTQSPTNMTNASRENSPFPGTFSSYSSPQQQSTQFRNPTPSPVILSSVVRTPKPSKGKRKIEGLGLVPDLSEQQSTQAKKAKLT